MIYICPFWVLTTHSYLNLNLGLAYRGCQFGTILLNRYAYYDMYLAQSIVKDYSIYWAMVRTIKIILVDINFSTFFSNIFFLFLVILMFPFVIISRSPKYSLTPKKLMDLN